MKILIGIAAVALIAGCSAGSTSRETPAAYDFGPQRVESATAKSLRASILLHTVGAPAWLDTNGVVYRLAYQDAARQQMYVGTRWVSAPALLLTQQLRARLAAVSEGGVVSAADGARADYALRVELDEFSQIFDAADRSRGVVVARASLVNTAKRALIAQRSFTFERAAGSNADGGVRALAGAGGELADGVVAWAAAAVAQDKR